jgi:HSP20 family protein
MATYSPTSFYDIVENLASLPFVLEQENRRSMAHNKRRPQGGLHDHAFSSSLDLYDRDNEAVVVVQVPGANKEDISIDYDPATSSLVISGETQRPNEYTQNDGDKSLRVSEIFYGKFERRIQLGRDSTTKFDADGTSAKLESGVLTVTIPKVEVEPKKKITVA